MRVLRAARDASPEAMEKLIRCMRDETADWNARIRACNIILDRAWGSEAKVEIDTDRVQGITIIIERGQVSELQQQPLTIEGSSTSESVDR